MLDDISAKQMMVVGSMTPPQRQRYTVITSPITPVTPRNDDDLYYFEGVPASSLQEDFVDLWLLVGSGQRDGRAKDVQASSSNNARPVEQPLVSAEVRDGKSCRTDPVCSAKKLPVKRKLCLSSDESAEKNTDSSLSEKTRSRDRISKRQCKENVDPSNDLPHQALALSKNYNENKDVCVPQPISVPATQTTATVQPATACSVSVEENSRRGFQPYVLMSQHSAVHGHVGFQFCSRGENQEKSNSNNSKSYKDLCVSQQIIVPETQTTATVQPATACSVSVEENSRRGFQPYVPSCQHSAVHGLPSLPSYSKGENQIKSNSHNPDRVVPEMFNTNDTTNTTRFYDYSSFYNGSFYPYQSGTWNPYNAYNPTMFTSGMPQGPQQTPMYPQLYNGTYQTTSTTGYTVPSQNYGTVLYTQTPVSSAMLPDISQFMNTGGHYKGNTHQSQSSNSSYAAGAHGYQNPYFYNTYTGAGSNNTSTFQN